MGTVIDFSAGFPDAAAIKNAGHEGVVAYISPAREPWMKGKPLTKEVVDRYKAQGLSIAVVWQYGGANNADTLRGVVGGRDDAKAAAAQLEKIGLKDHPVFFAVDFNVTLSQWNSTVVEYFRGAAEVLGRQRVGIYGHSRAVAWAKEDGVVADFGDGHVLGWVTSSWSDDRGEGYAVLYQGTHNVPGPSGIQIDINTVLHSQWGQAPVKEPEIDLSALPRVDETVWMNQHTTPGRFYDGREWNIEYVTRHHMGGIGDARQCYKWWQDREASAHFAVDKNGKVGQLVPEKDTAWSNAKLSSNVVSVSIEHSNCGGPDEDWPISDATIIAGARLAAELCIKHGLGRPQFGKNIRDHCEFGATGCPYHLRNGGKYHDKWMREAQSHYDNLTRPKEKEMTDADRALLNEVNRKMDLLIDFIAGPAKDWKGWPATKAWPTGTRGKATLEYLSTVLEDIHSAVVK